MASTGSTYGNYNPAAVDPFPIESVLAAKAAPDSAQAQTMLDLYQLKNQANSNIYGSELDKQHDFNRQQLQQQLKEAYLKAAPEFAKTPGGAGLLASAPDFQGALGGASPQDVARFVGQSEAATNATNLEHLGSGASSFSTAGMPIPEGAIQGMTGLPFKQGVRPDVQIGAGHDAARMAAARIGAANKGPLGTIQRVGGLDEGGGQSTYTINRLPGQSMEGAQADLDKLVAGDTARRQGTGPAGTTSHDVDTSSPIGKNAQTNAMRNMDVVSKRAAAGDTNAKAIQADVDATRKGAAYNVVRLPSGAVGIQGKTQFYPLPNG